MAKTKRTYIVNVRKGKKVTGYTLRDWCEMIGLNYNTVLARICRSNPTVTDGVVYFEEDDPIVRHAYGYGKEGRPGEGERPARRTPGKRVTERHASAADGDFTNDLQPSAPPVAPDVSA